MGINNQYSEQEIVKACIEDDRKMQKLLYDKYCDAMFTTSYRILSDFDIANDSLQEAFIKIFLNLKKFRGDSTLGAWIKMIVVRTALTRLKKEKIFVPLDESHIELMVSIPNDYKSEYLEKAVFELPDGFRTIFVMIEVEGYSHREVAEFLSISESTSRSQLFHAKRRLRDKVIKMRDSV